MVKTFLGIFLLLFAFSGTACDKDKFQKARQTVKTIERLLPVATDIVNQLRDEELLEQKDADAITSTIEEAQRAISEFNYLADQHQTLSPENKKELIQKALDLVKNLSASLEKLNDDGVLHIKNPKRKAEVGRILRTISISSHILQATLVEDDVTASPPQ